MKKYLRNLVMAAMCAGLGVSAQAALTLSNYEATVEAQNPGFFFTFNGGSLANVVNSGTPTLSASASVADQFIYDIFENPTNCVFFTIVGDYLNDPSESSDHILSGGGTATSNSTAVGTITLLFRPPDPGPPSGVTTGPSGHCVFSAGGTLSSDNAFSLIIQNPNSYSNPPCSLVLAFGDSTNVLLAASNLVWDAWYYFALTYNESDTSTNKATWYLGRLTGAGTLATGTTLNTNVAVAGDGTDFYLGSEPSAVTTLCKPGDGRVDEVATWNKQLTAAQIQAQFAALPNPAVPPVSAYRAVITNQAPTHYFQLNSNTVDTVTGSSLTVTNWNLAVGVVHPITNYPPFQYTVGYSYDYFLDPFGAAYFATGSDAIWTNVNLLNGGGTFTGSLGSGKGSVSGMFHALACTNYYIGQKFIFDAGGDTGTSNSFALLLESTNAPSPYSLKMRFGDSTSVLVSDTNILSEWYYFAITYDETTSTNQAQWWVGRPGGTLQYSSFTALTGSLAGAGNVFVIGNEGTNGVPGSDSAFRYQQSSHTSNGQVSQLAIWNRILGSNEVAAQFNALSASTPVLPFQITFDHPYE